MRIKIGITAPDRFQCYRRWWRNKYLKDGRQIIGLEWCGTPSGIYGDVTLILDDGTKTPVWCPGYRPRKKDLTVYDKPPKVGE
ncbi:MAG: hypothetical protein H8D45_20930 [Bacteroidetes bacterium]|nr:hypothetical protein [Bacteroidota bacterium]